MKKYLHIVITVIVTAIVLATAFLGYTFYNEIQVVTQNNAALTDLSKNFAQYVIQSIQSQQQAQSQPQVIKK